MNTPEPGSAKIVITRSNYGSPPFQGILSNVSSRARTGLGGVSTNSMGRLGRRDLDVYSRSVTLCVGVLTRTEELLKRLPSSDVRVPVWPGGTGAPEPRRTLAIPSSRVRSKPARHPPEPG